MARTTTAVVNWIIGFVLAFLVVSRFRNRKSGLKAGLVWGTVSAIASAALYGRIAEDMVVTEADLDSVDTVEVTAESDD